MFETAVTHSIYCDKCKGRSTTLTPQTIPQGWEKLWVDGEPKHLCPSCVKEAKTTKFYDFLAFAKRPTVEEIS